MDSPEDAERIERSLGPVRPPARTLGLDAADDGC